MQFIETLNASLQGLAVAVGMIVLTLVSAIAILQCWKFVVMVWRS